MTLHTVGYIPPTHAHHKQTNQQAKAHERDIVAALQYQDSNSSGLVTAKQFTKAMAQCNVELSETDVQRLTLRFDRCASALAEYPTWRVRYLTFCFFDGYIFCRDREESQCIDIEKFTRFIRGQPYNFNDDDGTRCGLA